MLPRQAPSPAALAAVIQSFQLTPAESLEVEIVKVNLKSMAPTHLIALEDMALATTNVGVQYLLLQRSNLIRFIASNPRLDSRVVPLFLDRVENSTRGSLYSAEISSVNLLLSHEVVVRDVNLFKRTWSASRLVSPQPASPLGASMHDFGSLFEALDSHSAASGDEENAMSIDTLLFILAYLSGQDEKYEIDSELGIARSNALVAREDEIKVWIQDNMSDFSGFSLAWVLKAYDLYQVA